MEISSNSYPASVHLGRDPFDGFLELLGRDGCIFCHGHRVIMNVSNFGRDLGQLLSDFSDLIMRIICGESKCFIAVTRVFTCGAFRRRCSKDVGSDGEYKAPRLPAYSL